MKQRIYSYMCAAASAALLQLTPAAAENNLVLILDASNSMWGQIDGEAKINTAKDVLGDLTVDVPKETRVAVMAYGHNEKESCSDVEILLPLTPVANADVNGVVSPIKPKGKTPIAYALKQGGSLVAGAEEDANNIVVVSDGIETCEGDPCSVAEELAAKNVNTRLHVVGFDVDDEARKQLQCIADKGRGKYFDASNTSDFKDAIAAVKREAVEQEPVEEVPTKRVEPVEPKERVVFFDQFEREELGSDWEVINGDEESYLVDNGELLLVSSQNAGLQDEAFTNLFRLKEELPKGDFEAEIQFFIEANSGLEQFFIGAYNDSSKWIVSGASFIANKYNGHKIDAYSAKSTGKDEVSRLENVLTNIRCNVCAADKQWKNFKEERIDGTPVTLKLRRKGRDYIASASFSEKGKEFFSEKVLGAQKSLRPLKNLVFGLTNLKRVSVESSVNIQYVKITAIP